MKTHDETQEERRKTRALARFAAVQAVLQGVQAGQPLARALEYACTQAWAGRIYNMSTIETWYYAYRKEGFGSLEDKIREDLGKCRALEGAEVESLLELRQAYPLLTLKALAKELVRTGKLQEGRFSLSTLYRRLAEAGLDRQSMKMGSGVKGPTKAFEVPLPNMLWMADCMHGVPIRTEQGAQKTFLFALIDDCTRVCVHAQFYAYERLEGFLDTLRKAVQGRGVPDKLYTDNGSAFISQQLAIVCANLGTRLLHCKPYHSWSKGKIERFFLTVQNQFQATLLFEPVKSLEHLNQRFWKWLETDYHQREHAALQGESPSARFARLGQSIRLLDKAAPLDRWFGMEQKRRVRKDATFSLDGRYWEVASHLKGQIVTVYYDPVTYNRVEVALRGQIIGVARPCDKHRNAQLASSTHCEYES
jgi:transposase InsO family protein